MKTQKSLLTLALLTFACFSCTEGPADETDTNGTAAKVITIEASDIMSASMTTGGNITSDGGAEITDRGVCYGTEPSVTIESAKVSAGSGKGAFEVELTGLEQKTVYYYRAYAVNAAGVSYGEEMTAETKVPELATVVTAEVTNAAGNSATCGGDIKDNGNAKIIGRGVCWSENDNPTIDDNKTEDGTGEGVFTSSITGLEVGKTYYVRAYATNDAGTAYGETKSFATIEAQLPTIEGFEVTDKTSVGAKSGGNITSDGGAQITARGVCWATHKEPTIDDNKTEDGTGAGEFTSEITGLTEGTVYYLRAYATNAIGTVYGEEKPFAPFYLDNGESMARITGGTFTVGEGGTHTDAGANTWQCTLPDYYIAKTEVTQQLWAEIMGTEYLEQFLSESEKEVGYICYPVGADDYNPQPKINWFDAIIFCNKLSAARGEDPCYYMEINGNNVTDPDLWEKTGEWEKNIKCDFNKGGFRLPTLPEWEFAAGGGEVPLQKYPGTDDFSELYLYGQIEGSLPGGATEGLFTVATRLPNKLGLYDMVGNATEWVWELRFEYPADARTYYDDVIDYNYGDRKAVKKGGTVWNWEQQVYLTTSNWSDPIDDRNWPCGMRLARTCLD